MDGDPATRPHEQAADPYLRALAVALLTGWGSLLLLALYLAAALYSWACTPRPW